MPRVSVTLAVWNTGHLLVRTLETLTTQTFSDFEVLIIDDASEDDVPRVISRYAEDLTINYHRLEHDFGMRGNTVSFNVAFSLAQGEIIFESTPEIMLYPSCIEDMVTQLDNMGHRSWVSVRTYNLVPEDQLLIDTVDWKSDVRNLEKLPNFDCPWTRNNEGSEFFGTHQTCVFYRADWFKYWERYPFFCGYGTDDPWNAGKRKEKGIIEYTIKPFVYHQWHAPIGYWSALDKAWNWNAWGHSMCNYYNDPLVPEGGTAMLWDKDRPEGPYHQMDEEQKKGWLDLADKVKATGFRRKR